jgi:hypothetical protein
MAILKWPQTNHRKQKRLAVLSLYFWICFNYCRCHILFVPFLSFFLNDATLAILHSVRDRIINECGEVGGMRIGRGNLSTRETPHTVRLCHHISNII